MIYLHIGPHKTGTTYIQRCFGRVAEQLSERGLVYPDLGMNLDKPHTSHIFLGRFWEKYVLPGGEHYAEFKGLGDSVLADGKNLLFSSEAMCRWPPERFVKLANLFGQDKLEICYFVRDPYDVFASHWAEQMKHGRTAGFSESFEASFNTSPPSRVVNPVVDVLPLARHERLDVSLYFYDRIKKDEQDIFAVLMERWLDVSDVGVPRLKRYNERLPLEMTEFFRLLTKRTIEANRIVGSVIRQKFYDRSNFLHRRKIIKTISRHGAPCLREMTIPRDSGYVPQLEARIRNVLGPHLKTAIPDGPLFPRHDAVLPYYDAESLEKVPEIVEMIDRTAKRLGLPVF